MVHCLTQCLPATENDRRRQGSSPNTGALKRATPRISVGCQGEDRQDFWPVGTTKQLITWTTGHCRSIYRVIQKESAILWGMIVCVILSKEVHMNMGLILNSYQDMVKRRYGPSCEHE